MKKPILLEQGMVDGFLKQGLVTPEEYQKISRTYNEAWAEKELVARGADMSDADRIALRLQLAEERVQRIRCAALALARPRMTETDSLGRRLLSTDEFVGSDLFSAAGAVKDPIEDRAKVSLRTGVHMRGVDHSIAPFITRITKAGYHTAASCSGTLADHPNYRYVTDNLDHGYAKGEPINYNKQGSGAYIAFYKEPHPDGWDAGMPGCTPQQIEDIRRVAEEIGWVVEENPTYFRDSLQLYMPVTLDGSGKRELLAEANAMANDRFPDLRDDDFFKWLDAREDFMSQVYDRHGGVVLFTDDMIKGYWDALASKLELAARLREQQLEERLASVDSPDLIRIDAAVHPRQLAEILQRQGYRLDGKALTGWPVQKGTSLLKDGYLQIDGDVAYRASRQAIQNTEARVRSLSFMAVRQQVSDIQVPGLGAGQGATVTCRLDGVAQPAKTFSQGVITSYAIGNLTDMQVAVAHYVTEALARSAVQTIEVSGQGHKTTDGTSVSFVAAPGTDGTYYFKDSDAFHDRDGICYISAASMALAEVEELQQTDKLTHTLTQEQAQGYGFTYDDFVQTARIYGLTDPHRAADAAFHELKGQSVDTWFKENAVRLQTEQETENRLYMPVADRGRIRSVEIRQDRDGTLFLHASVDNVPQPRVRLDSQLADAYLQGSMDRTAVACAVFKDKLAAGPDDRLNKTITR